MVLFISHTIWELVWEELSIIRPTRQAPCHKHNQMFGCHNWHHKARPSAVSKFNRTVFLFSVDACLYRQNESSLLFLWFSANFLLLFPAFKALHFTSETADTSPRFPKLGWCFIVLRWFLYSLKLSELQKVHTKAQDTLMSPVIGSASLYGTVGMEGWNFHDLDEEKMSWDEIWNGPTESSGTGVGLCCLVFLKAVNFYLVFRAKTSFCCCCCAPKQTVICRQPFSGNAPLFICKMPSTQQKKIWNEHKWKWSRNDGLLNTRYCGNSSKTLAFASIHAQVALSVLEYSITRGFVKLLLCV